MMTPKGVQFLLDEIGRKLAKHKLIPFIGAGVSRPQLGVGAPELRARLVEAFGVPSAPERDLAAVAQFIEDTKGSEALIASLSSHLYRTEFDDSTGATHLQILSLDCGLIYTTNQDNISELAGTKYNRAYKVIVTHRDL